MSNSAPLLRSSGGSPEMDSASTQVGLWRPMHASHGSSVVETQFTARFTVVKTSSWRGKYTRIFAVGPNRVSTIDAKTIFKVTNTFEFGSGGFHDIVPSRDSSVEFSILVSRGSNKSETMIFTCLAPQERAELLTAVQQNRHLFDPGVRQITQGRVTYASAISASVFEVGKHTFNDATVPVALRVTCVKVEELDKTCSEAVGGFLFADIKGHSSIEGRPNTVIIAHGPTMKLHLYTFPSEEQAGAFTKLLEASAQRFIGLPPYRKMNMLTMEQFTCDRFGIKRDALETAVDFAVLKYAKRHGIAPTRRLLGTTPVVLVERDPTTYNTVGAYLLTSIFSLVRCAEDDQRFIVHLKDPVKIKVYTSPERDALLAHLNDACREAGNHNVSIVSEVVKRGLRMCSLRNQATEDMESTLLNTIVEAGKKADSNFAEVVAVFNASIEYSGLRWSENRDSLFAENREKLIYNAIYALLYNFPSGESLSPALLEQQFQALRRLTVSRIGFSSVAVVPALAKAVGAVSVRALLRHNTSLTYAVIDFLNTLMTPRHDHYEVEHESVNKNRIAGAESFLDSLVTLLKDNIYTHSASLVVQGLLDMFVYILCPPYSETTNAAVFNRVMEKLVADIGKGFFSLLNHPCHAIRYSSGQLIRVVMEEGSEEQFRYLQRASLTEGGVLMEFNVGAFGKNRKLRDLARRLLAYWTYEYTPMQDLLRRMMPLTMLNYLQSTEEPPGDEREESPVKGVSQMTQQFRDSKQGWFRKSFHPKDMVPQSRQHTNSEQQPQNGEGGLSKRQLVKPSDVGDAAVAGENDSAQLEARPPPPPDRAVARMRVRNVRVHTTLNWAMLFYQLKQNHLQPDLIWTHTTRDELRHAIESELETFTAGAELRRGDRAIAWNYQEFEVVYHSLDDEIKIGQHYYPRLLFEASNPVIARPKEFFNELYHRFLLTEEPKGRLECLHGMSILYRVYAAEIGDFSDLPFLVRMFQTTTDPAFRDRMLLFISHALGARHNVKLLLDCNALASLAEQVTLAHLHIDRPQVHAVSNAIEDAGGSLRDLQGREKEWYYSKGGVKADPVSYTALKDLYTNGEVDENTKVWAQGMSGWKALKDVAQLRWGVVCAGKPSILTYTEVTCTILDIFQRICDHYPTRDEDGAVMQPLPRVKRYLSSPAVLPHLVQLLLTFDSAVCSRVHQLLYSLMMDNPLIGRFFLTGAFYFSLLYSASDVVPMAKLLHLAHRQQAYQHSQTNNTIVRSSILAPLLPPAMVCYLTHHGPEKFADVFLGEYETPEIIWGKGMRQYLAGKVAAHIAEFTPRLLGNNLVQYQYCPIVGVEYEQLQHELFCSEYYLRHLCDEAKYPDWPIRDPIYFLRDVLSTWQAELQKEPCKLTREGCLAELELGDKADTVFTEGGQKVNIQVIRKAYFALAAKYHPDKNPTGREKFEKIQEAYEFLAENRQYSTEPDPKNIRLLLKSQSILFRRYGEALQAYKYAGYGLLLSLVKSELAADDMLDKDIVLMEPATELCFATVKNVPLNTDELQEEGGVSLLSAVAARCMEHVNLNSKPEDAAVRVATHCMLAFSVSAQFRDSRAKLRKETHLPYLAAKGVAYHETLMSLSRACIQCCETLCLDAYMQGGLTKVGVIWHLLRLLFCYDPTIVAAGVTLEEAHHKQLFANRAAQYALRAVYSLVGFHPDKSYCHTERNSVLVALLQKLLTPHIVMKMETVSGFETEALALLNGNSETPYFLWNNTSRAELEELLLRNSEICRDASIEAKPAELPSYDLDRCQDEGEEPFEYSIHKGETIVGGVFVRLYVAQPAFAIEDPAGLFGALLDSLSHRTGFDRSKAASTTAGEGTGAPDERAGAEPSLLQDSVVAMIVTCVKNLTLAYPAVVTPLAAHRVSVLLHLFSVFTTSTVVLAEALALLDRLLAFEPCVAAFGAEPSTITRFIFVLHESGATKADEEIQVTALQALRVMFACRPLVQQALDRGMYMVLLHLYATGRAQSVKEASCACLGKLFADKLVGPKLYRRCAAYLPTAFLDSMRDGTNPAQSCVMLDRWQENPELLWTKERKDAFVAVTASTVHDIAFFLTTEPCGTWQPHDVEKELTAEMTAEKALQHTQVGGVFLSLYLQQAGWQVRKPKEFLVALLDSYLEEATALQSSASPAHADTPPQCGGASTAPELRLNLIADSGVRLLSSSSAIRDYAASLGYMHKIIDLVAPNDAVQVMRDGDAHYQVPITALRWLHQLWQSTPCVEATAPKSVVQPLLRFLFGREPAAGTADMTIPTRKQPYLPLVLETLEQLFTHSTYRVGTVEQAVSCDLHRVLLRLLESGVPSLADPQEALPTDGNGGALPAGVAPPTVLSPAATRALIIKVIKAMVTHVIDAAAGENLKSTLASSAVWAKYKDQSHDLFLTSGNTAAFGGYITSGDGGTARGNGGQTLSLTVAAASTYQELSEPPPLHHD